MALSAAERAGRWRKRQAARIEQLVGDVAVLRVERRRLLRVMRSEAHRMVAAGICPSPELWSILEDDDG